MPSLFLCIDTDYPSTHYKRNHHHTGFKFRPAPDNPYLSVRSEDQEGAEYGLDDEEDGVQLLPASGSSSKKIGSGRK